MSMPRGTCSSRGGPALAPGTGWDSAQRAANEDVGLAVRIVANQVRCEGGEGDEPPVGGDRGAVAVAVSLPAGLTGAHPPRPAGPAVADEDVRLAVRVVADQVRSLGVEC